MSLPSYCPRCGTKQLRGNTYCGDCGELFNQCGRCAVVAKGSRVRLTEASAQLIEALLRSARRSAVRARRAAINADNTPERQTAEGQIKLVDFVIEEIEDVQFTNGWHAANGALYE